VHPNTVRFHLQALVDSGRVEQVESTSASPGRPPFMFRARPGMDPAGPRNYQLLAEALATRLRADTKGPGEAIEAGQAWGRRMVAASSSAKLVTNDDHATDELVGMLRDLGFSPQLRPSAHEAEIGLRHCPFLELVPEYQSVICPMHLGLMRGAMEAMSSKITIERLEPFAEPDLCLAHIGTSTATV
jgi:predicted ArsR family transcriptional regulator